MFAFAIPFALLAVSSQAAAIDDSACNFFLSSFGCIPETLCSYQFHFGDLTPNQSCRVRPDVNKAPQQMHLAYAGSSPGTAMTISWATFDDVKESAVWIGTSENELDVSNEAVTSATYYSRDNYELYQHHVTVDGLEPNTRYYYKVGTPDDDKFQSEVASFVTAREASDDSAFDILVYGDVGFDDNAMDTITYVNQLSSDASIDFVLHLGDLGYADNSYLKPSQALGFFYEQVYNKWMNMMTPLMSVKPYMVVVGNHEAECHSPNCQLSSYKQEHLGNYSAYNARFPMPSEDSGGTLSMWYSFDTSKVHMSCISSETDYEGAPTNHYTLQGGNGNFGDQLAWLEKDLQAADENRDNVPWIIVSMHRPLYTADTANAQGVPTDYSAKVQAAFEDLFIKYKVDVVLSGHEHSYERQAPIKKSKAVMDGVSNDGTLYEKPQAPVYIVTGAAGNIEDHTDLPSNPPAWNMALDDQNFGVSRVTVNRDSLKWTFTASSSGKVLDSFTMTK